MGTRHVTALPTRSRRPNPGAAERSPLLFKTTNALAASPTWVNVSPPVNIPCNAIAVDPGGFNVLYVGTDLGIWKTTDGGAPWAHMGPESGLPNVAIFDLQINSATNTLIAFTHGRSAFALTARRFWPQRGCSQREGDSPAHRGQTLSRPRGWGGSHARMARE